MKRFLAFISLVFWDFLGFFGLFLAGYGLFLHSPKLAYCIIGVIFFCLGAIDGRSSS